MTGQEVVVCPAVGRRRADGWSLVLSSQGIQNELRREPEGFVVVVDLEDREVALRSLAAYEKENAAPPPRPAEPTDRIRELDRLVGVGSSALMLAFFAATGARNPDVVWFAQGSADGSQILSGELWRTVTALTLHADLGHVASNALFGALFFSAVSAGFGPGVGLFLTAAAGAAGNLANAIFQGPDHVSVGASTAVFGAVGLLAGRGVARRLRQGQIGFRIWIPIAAGLALIAMLGTGERSDVWAHAFGFLAGGFLGIPASLAWRGQAGRTLQWSALALALLAILGSWRAALA